MLCCCVVKMYIATLHSIQIIYLKKKTNKLLFLHPIQDLLTSQFFFFSSDSVFIRHHQLKMNWCDCDVRWNKIKVCFIKKIKRKEKIVLVAVLHKDHCNLCLLVQEMGKVIYSNKIYKTTRVWERTTTCSYSKKKKNTKNPKKNNNIPSFRLTRHYCPTKFVAKLQKEWRKTRRETNKVRQMLPELRLTCFFAIVTRNAITNTHTHTQREKIHNNHKNNQK